MGIEYFYSSEFIAKALGYLILAGSIGLKVPQILNILSSKTVEGISPISFYGEVPLYLTTVIYNILQNNPFSSYGESVFILVQNLILVILLWIFMKPVPSSTTMISVMTSFVVIGVVSYYLPPNLQPLLPLVNLPLSIASRIPQIVQNTKAKSTGQLSFPTTLLQFGGALVRVFTTIKEVGWDLSLLAGFLIGAGLSGILLLQILLYNNPFLPQSSEKDKKKSE